MSSRGAVVVGLGITRVEAQRLIAKKETRDYTRLQRDLLEADVAHLQAASELYDELALRRKWARIECFDAALHALRRPAAVHEEILAAVETRMFSALRDNR